jgi:predicted transcriptional regulator
LDRTGSKISGMRAWQSVPLRDVMTERSLWIAASLGFVPETIVALLTDKRYDEAPVLSAGTPIGIVETAVLQRLLSEGQPLTEGDIRSATQRNLIQSGRELTADVFSLLELLIDRKSVFVRQVADGKDDIVGLLTQSDLNRQPFRSALFEPLCELEAELALLIEKQYPAEGDNWPWLTLLNEDAKVRLLGYWHLSRREGVDLYPTVAATLQQLLTIIEKDETLRSVLGYQSATKVARATAHLSHLRNSVMHPVRHLVLKSKDVKTLADTLTGAVDLLDRARGARNRMHAARQLTNVHSQPDLFSPDAWNVPSVANRSTSTV